MNQAVSTATVAMADPCVAASGRSLTHPQVRSLSSSTAPWPRPIPTAARPFRTADPRVAANGRSLTTSLAASQLVEGARADA